MRVTIKQAIRFGIRNSFSLYPVEGCDAGPILNFEALTYSILLKDGHLVGDFWLSEVENRDIPQHSICLVYNEDALDKLLDYTPPESIVQLLSNAHLAKYIESPVPSLRLISKASLYGILPEHLGAFSVKRPRELEATETCRLKTRQHVKDLLEKSPDFSGRTMVCDVMAGDMPCNEPCCHSEFAWSKDGTVLFYMSAGSDLITGAWLLPKI